ncbi:MAG: hypothetical protein ACI9EB_001236 [Pseudomonas sp.]|jgi:hypothetical protein
MAQRLVCTRAHSMDQQFCRWLLQCFDRLPANHLQMTQELIANMLRVRCGGVSEIAGNLQRAGLTSNRRGRITLLDRPGLEQRSCERYAVVKNELKRLFTRALSATLHCPATVVLLSTKLGLRLTGTYSATGNNADQSPLDPERITPVAQCDYWFLACRTANVDAVWVAVINQQYLCGWLQHAIQADVLGVICLRALLHDNLVEAAAKAIVKAEPRPVGG